jgi:RNA polymerase sigma-70 factor (ECF subfamily)
MALRIPGLEGESLTVSTQEVWKEFRDRLKAFIRQWVPNEADAEDILQEVFCKIHGNLHQLEDAGKLQPWVYQIARNAMLDHFRQTKGKSESVELPLGLRGASGAANFNDEIVSCFKPMIEHLPGKYKEALFLTDLEGLTQKELSERLGLSLSGAKSRVQRARERLKEMLLDCCVFEFDRFGNVLTYQRKKEGVPGCLCEPPRE